ncbi:MAG: TonB-dependent receptor [Acidobacteriota bacterium]
MRSIRCCLCRGVLGLVWLLPLALAGGDPPQSRRPRDLAEISLEELMNVEVTSVSKKEQPLNRVPAAVYVITREDIRRSGVTTIPEALRMVPGLQVARIDSSKWAISARGFNGRWSNKLLVMIDGRRVLSPVFSGVYWDMQDVFLEDVERIEVIRGPGATLWGAGAVNGVINVITRHAKDTQGGLVAGGYGTQEDRFGGLRYGGKAGEAWYRVYFKYFLRDPFSRPSSDSDADHSDADHWAARRTGFRMDWEPSERDQITVQGDAYHSHAGQIVSDFSLAPPYNRTLEDRAEAHGGNLLARWRRVFSSRSQMALQVYYDRASRAEAVNAETITTWDVDFQHRYRLGARHDLQWGVEGRFMSDYLPARPMRIFTPEREHWPLFSGFFQDEVSLVEGRLYLTLGTKLERNFHTGGDVQPGAQLLWNLNRNNTLWASVSRAARPPSRMNRDIRLNLTAMPGFGGMPNVVSAFGNEDFRSESLRAHELGYRFQTKRFSADLTAFYNVYNRLESTRALTPFVEQTPEPVHLVLPITFGNDVKGKGYGAELAAAWNVADRWKLSGNYSWLRLRLRAAGTAPLLEPGRGEKDSPEHQAHLRSYLDLPKHLSFDAALYRVGSLPAPGGLLARPVVPAYTRVDTRLGWRPTPKLELSLAVENLLDARHAEFLAIESLIVPGNQGRRNLYGKVTWRW